MYTGFKPAFVLTKESRHNSTSTSSGYSETSNAGRWVMYDNASSPYNGAPAVAQHIYGGGGTSSDLPNDNGYQTWTQMDFVSNGFILNGADSEVSEPGQYYIFAAFADSASVSLSPIIILFFISPCIISITFVRCLGSGLQ